MDGTGEAATIVNIADGVDTPWYLLDTSRVLNPVPGVFHCGVDPRKKVHLTGKPVALVKDLLAVAATGVNVLDPFLGGGTTALACVETGRRFIGVELSPEYAALAAERIHVVEAALK